MSKSRSAFTSSFLDPDEDKQADKKLLTKKPSEKATGDCQPSQSTSHTQFFKKQRYDDEYKRITTDEYYGDLESISSSDTFLCVHGAEGKLYTEEGQLKRNLLKGLDPVPVGHKWNEQCPPSYGWDMAKKLEFLVTDPIGVLQTDRLEDHIHDFAKTAEKGLKIDVLDSLCTILDYLVETLSKKPILRKSLVCLLQVTDKPILLNVNSDVVTFFESLKCYLGFLGYLLIRMEDDELFDWVANALMCQLTVPDAIRGAGTVHLRHCLAAAAPVLYQTTVRMLAVATPHRFPTFLEIALLLACDNAENCIQMMRENIIENIFYRFNPYFPDKRLPEYEINPADPQDFNVKLGESSKHLSTTLSVLLVLLKTTKEFLEEKSKYRRHFPCPDNYGQRCFVWAYRYECRARERRHQRATLTVVAATLLNVFGDRLMEFSTLLMPDVMSLSVLTELPARADWTSTVNFNTSQADVQFKKLLIHLCVDFLKVFPYNKFMVEYRHWLLGLLYLLDPQLCHLRAKWSQTLFGELRKTSLQALVCSLRHMDPKLPKEYGLIRRIMWYIEWYSEKPYELGVLYWCVRLLQVASFQRGSPTRKEAIKDLFDTHGIIILMKLCHTLLEQKMPPVEKGQAIIALSLRLLTSAVETSSRLSCCVYSQLKWPGSINSLARKMLDIVLYSLEKHFIVSDRWLISLLNFIWEAIIWRKEFRDKFIANNGIYKLLDIITMSRPSVQCIALALVCDAARAGDAVGQLVSWRANLGASQADPKVVKRGATVVGLLAAIFRNECQVLGIHLNENGVIEELDNPLMTTEMRREINNPKEGSDKPLCWIAADLAGSRMSKAYALLHMLSEDMEYAVSLADEAYNLYKNITLSPEDEALMVLCSHYLTLKLNETWQEVKSQTPGPTSHDETILNEFLHISKGWANEIKRQQEDVIAKDKKKEHEEECSLYAFLGRVRLNVALDAMREVRCVARSADRERIAHALIQDAVSAHHRRSRMVKRMDAPVLRTYGPPLDDQNITGQYRKVYSILPKSKPKPVRDDKSS